MQLMTLDEVLTKYEMTLPLSEDDVIRIIDFTGDCSRYELAAVILASFPDLSSSIDLALSVYVEADLKSDDLDLKGKATLWKAKKARIIKEAALINSIQSKKTSCVIDSGRQRGWFIEHADDNNYWVRPFDIATGISKKVIVPKNNLVKQNIGGIIPLDAKIIPDSQAISIAHKFKGRQSQQAVR